MTTFFDGDIRAELSRTVDRLVVSGTSLMDDLDALDSGITPDQALEQLKHLRGLLDRVEMAGACLA